MADSGAQFRTDQLAAQASQESSRAQERGIATAGAGIASGIQEGVLGYHSRRAAAFDRELQLQKLGMEQQQAAISNQVATAQLAAYGQKLSTYHAELDLRMKRDQADILASQAQVSLAETRKRVEELGAESQQLKESGQADLVWEDGGKYYMMQPTGRGRAEPREVNNKLAEALLGRQATERSRSMAQARYNNALAAKMLAESGGSGLGSVAGLGGGNFGGSAKEAQTQPPQIASLFADRDIASTVAKAGDNPAEVSAALQWIAGLIRDSRVSADPAAAERPPEYWLDLVGRTVKGDMSKIDQYLALYRKHRPQK